MGGMGGLREKENLDPASTSPYADVLIFWGKGGGRVKDLKRRIETAGFTLKLPVKL